MFLHGYAMALDPELWDEPDEFRPERWLAETPGSGPRNAGLDLHGKESRKNMEHYKYIPFSMGPRTCPGYSFGKVSLFLQAATTMQAFRWSLSPSGAEACKASKGKLDLTENPGLTIMPLRYGEMGYIKATARPAARLSQSQPGD